MNSLDDLYYLATILNNNKIKFIITGGIAMAFYEEPRATKDLDIIVNVDSEDKSKIVNIMRGINGILVKGFWVDGRDPGLVDRFSLPFWSQLDIFYCENKNFKQLFKKSVKFKWRDLEINVIDINSLIIKKLNRLNKQDLADIEKLREIQRGSIRKW